MPFHVRRDAVLKGSRRGVALARRVRLRACLLALAASIAACGGDAAAPTVVDELAGRIEAQRAGIVETIGAASCGAASQCGALPIGAKPCGGPATHLPYSTIGTDLALLESQAAGHRALSRELNLLLGLLSDCSVVAPPPLACDQGRCRFAGP